MTGSGTGGGGQSAGGSGGARTTGSGGSSSGFGGSGGRPTFDSDGGTNCGLQNFELIRKPADLFLVLDRSASMQDDNNGDAATTANPSKWSQVVPAVTNAVTQTDTDVSWGLKTFPQDGNSCTTGTVTPKIDVPIAAMNAAAVNAAIMTTTPEGNGTPTASAINVAVGYLNGLMDDHRKYILLATDGEPSCPQALTGENTTQARTDAVAAVTAAANGGIKTFVVGVATTKTTDAMTLNDLAAAGLEAQGNNNPLATKFFLSNNQTDLVNAVKAITAQISSCVFPLNPVPPVPGHIAVKVSGVKAPQDTTHTDGWDYTQGDFSELQVYGSWCDMIKTDANMVEIVYGCQDIIPS